MNRIFDGVGLREGKSKVRSQIEEVKAVDVLEKRTVHFCILTSDF
jgi:hypothetical protein